MIFEGGCYCGALRYRADGEPMLAGQCHCRECQYITGGMPNSFIAMPIKGFTYTKGTPSTFTRTDLARAVTREFCATCGTAIGTRPPPGIMMIVKVGTMDDPSAYSPKAAVHTLDAQPFHSIPEGIATFERLPPR
jgi:hypothetical protein